MEDNNIILTNLQIQQKIKRIAYQILEVNTDKKEIILAGITSNGFTLAKIIKDNLNQICDIHIELCEVYIDKTNPIKGVSTSIDSKKYENKSIVLVDDVLNSGTTLVYAVKHFLEVPLSQFKTAVLVNRNHKKYPVKADFKGISFSTSIQEHIDVKFINDQIIAYLK